MTPTTQPTAPRRVTVFTEEGGRTVIVEDCDGIIRLTIADSELSITATVSKEWLQCLMNNDPAWEKP